MTVTLPPERFYWALLDEPCPRRLTARQRTRLGYSFESVLPAPIESVHANYIAAGDRTIACAIDHDDLEQIRADGAFSLHPAAAPAFIAAQVEPPPLERLNLLTGAFEPPALARRRRRRAAEIVAAIILLTAILALGMQRRIDTAREGAAAADSARLAMLADILPPAPGAAGSQAPELRLVAELRRLQRTREAPAGDLVPPDAAAPLADVLTAWPTDLHLRTRQLRATPTEIHLQVAIDAIEEADALAAALRQAPGWQHRLPQVGPERSGGYLASITLVAAPEHDDPSSAENTPSGPTASASPSQLAVAAEPTAAVAEDP